MAEDNLLQLVRELASLGTKVDILMEKFDERAAKTEITLVEHERRLDDLETWKVKIIAGAAVISALVGFAFQAASILK